MDRPELPITTAHLTRMQVPEDYVQLPAQFDLRGAQVRWEETLFETA